MTDDSLEKSLGPIITRVQMHKRLDEIPDDDGAFAVLLCARRDDAGGRETLYNYIGNPTTLELMGLLEITKAIIMDMDIKCHEAEDE